MNSVIPSKKFLTQFNDPAPTVVPPAPMYTAQQVQEMQNQARKEEKDKLYKDKERLQKAAKEAEERAAKLQAELEQKKTAELAPNEQFTAKLDEIKKQLETEANARLRAEQEVQAERLERYRLTKIAEAGGEIIPELVQGSSVEQIDQSIQFSRAAFTQHTTDVINRLTAAGYQIAKAAPAPAPAAPASVPVVPSPHWVPPAGAGLPAAVAPPTAPPQHQPTNGLSPEQVAYITSEAGVRDGSFAKYRHLLLPQIRGAAGAPGVVPLPPLPPSSFLPPLPPSTIPSMPKPQVPPQPQYPMPGSQPQPVPVQAPGGQPLPPNAVNNLTQEQINQLAHDIRMKGPKSGAAALAAYDRFNPAHNPPEQ